MMLFKRHQPFSGGGIHGSSKMAAIKMVSYNQQHSLYAEFDASCSGKTVDGDISYRSAIVSPIIPAKVIGDTSPLAGRQLKSCMKVASQRDSLARIARTSRPEDIDISSSRCLQPVLEPKQIRFGNVEFREYTRRLSDNPSTSSGPPIGIGWDFNPEDTISIDLEVYEDDREGSRRTKRELAIPAGKFDVFDH